MIQDATLNATLSIAIEGKKISAEIVLKAITTFLEHIKEKSLLSSLIREGDNGKTLASKDFIQLSQQGELAKLLNQLTKNRGVQYYLIESPHQNGKYQLVFEAKSPTLLEKFIHTLQDHKKEWTLTKKEPLEKKIAEKQIVQKKRNAVTKEKVGRTSKARIHE